MGIYQRVMFNSQGEDTALADLQAGTSTTTGTFTVPYDGRLLKVILFWSGEAVSSLAYAVRVELTANNWQPNREEFELTMAGILTAPAVPVEPFEYVIDQPVSVNQPITGQFIYSGGTTPVTCNLVVIGVFSGP